MCFNGNIFKRHYGLGGLSDESYMTGALVVVVQLVKLVDQHNFIAHFNA